METEIFCKHINLRHMPMAGTTSFYVDKEENGATLTLRAYHKRLHDTGESPDHNHKESK